MKTAKAGALQTYISWTRVTY